MRVPISARFNLAAQISALLAGTAAVIGLVGYVTGSRDLVSAGTGLPGMSPITAACLIGLAVALIAAAREKNWLRRGAALLPGVIAAALLVDHALAHADTISPIVTRALFRQPAELSGRMSIATALTVMLIAVSLLSQRHWRLAADICAATGVAVAATALFGFASSVTDLYALPLFSTIAVHTAAALFLLSVGTLTIDPRPDDNRRENLLPLDRTKILQLTGICTIPLATDWILLSTIDNNVLGNIAICLLVLISGSLPVSLMILRDARSLKLELRDRRESLS